VQPVAWSPDGKFIAYNAENPCSKKFEVWMLPVSGDRKPFMFQKSRGACSGSTFSSDGRWFVYVSNESGRELMRDRRDIYSTLLESGCVSRS